MPEGPEVYALSLAFKTLGFSAEAYGKHLFVIDLHSGEKLDISFGLAGKIQINRSNLAIEKVNHPQLVSGLCKPVENFDDHKTRSGLFGVDWLTATENQLKEVVNNWTTQRKKQIGALLIDQHEICGIGVAWASEILHEANLSPTDKSNWFNFLSLTEPLICALIAVRKRAVDRYKAHLQGDMIDFINKWFENLYEIRKPIMHVYKKGVEQRVSGRIFFV